MLIYLVHVNLFSLQKYSLTTCLKRLADVRHKFYRFYHFRLIDTSRIFFNTHETMTPRRGRDTALLSSCCSCLLKQIVQVSIIFKQDILRFT